MKKYALVTDNVDFPEMCRESLYYVSTTAEIKAVFNSIYRGIMKSNTDLMMLFSEKPIFNAQKQVYAICVNDNRYVYIINSDTMLSLIVSGDVKEM